MQPRTLVAGRRLHDGILVAEKTAADTFAQPECTRMAVIRLRRIAVVKEVAEKLAVERRTRADAGQQPPAREHIHRRQIFGKPERVLIAELDDGRAEPDALRALRSGGQNRSRR